MYGFFGRHDSRMGRVRVVDGGDQFTSDAPHRRHVTFRGNFGRSQPMWALLSSNSGRDDYESG